MASMNISLPQAMKDWAEDQTQTGRYSNTSDYVRDLIRRDQDRQRKILALQSKVDDALNSGVSPNTLDDIKARLLQAKP